MLSRNKEKLLRARREHLGPSLSLAYKEPLQIVRGEGQFLFDENGGSFLDCVNNVCHVGHCHPRVVEAGQRQMSLLNTNTRYVHDNVVRYAKRLSGEFSEGLEVVFFVCSGSDLSGGASPSWRGRNYSNSAARLPNPRCYGSAKNSSSPLRRAGGESCYR